MKKTNKTIGLALMIALVFALPFFSVAHADSTTANTLTTNPTVAPDANGQGGFQLTVCDGPSLEGLDDSTAKALKGNITNYIPCDFNGAMIQIQHLINIAMVLGVLAAIVGFSWAGFLLISMSITGKMDDRKKAVEIFRKVVTGFVIMLVSWFVVYQILDWVVKKDSSGSSGVQYLLGNKSGN